MKEPLYQIMYVSSARPELTEDSLHEILTTAQINNADQGITGLLLHSEGNLIQLIEGPKSNAEALFEKIRHDPRHSHIMVLHRKEIEKRDFPEFKMGFRRVSQELLNSQIPTFTDIVEKRQLTDEALAGISRQVAIFLRVFARITQID